MFSGYIITKMLSKIHIYVTTTTTTTEEHSIIAKYKDLILSNGGLSVCLSTRSRDLERFSPALSHGYGGWVTPAAEHRVSCRAEL